MKNQKRTAKKTAAKNPERYSVTTTIRMPPDVKHRIKQLAARKNRSISDLVRATVTIFEELERVEPEGGYIAVVDGKGTAAKLLIS